jgi:hypothetical protein
MGKRDSNLSVQVLLIPFLMLAPFSWATDYYPPRLESYITSEVSIGVERKGSTDVIIRRIEKSGKSSSNTESRKITDSFKEKETTSKKKDKNPEKHKSRPTTSDLIGGVARAFSGDYSGLVDWGGKFAVHMMEPRYLWTVSNVYTTEKENTRYYVSSQEFKQDVSSEFTSQIEEQYTQDLNKGYIEFSVTVVNSGPKSIRIKDPVFVINFVAGDGRRYFGRQVLGATPAQAFFVIPGNGGRHIFTVRAKDLDIVALAENYNRSIGIEAIMQNVMVIHGQDAFTVSEIIEREMENSVRFELYYGSGDVVKFVDLHETRPTVGEFLREHIGNDFVELNDDLSSGSRLDDYILSIKGRRNNASRPLDNTEGEDLIRWKRWFVAVSDQDGQFLPFTVASKLRPGYSLVIGYYGAKDILGDGYRPVVFEKKGMPIIEGKPFKLDIPLQVGDQIEISNVEIKELTGSVVRYRVGSTVSPAPHVYSIPPIMDLELSAQRATSLAAEPYASIYLGPMSEVTHLQVESIRPKEMSFSDFILLRKASRSSFQHELPDEPVLSRLKVITIKQFLSLLVNPLHRELNDNPERKRLLEAIESMKPIINTISLFPQERDLEWIRLAEALDEVVVNKANDETFYSIAIDTPVPAEENFWVASTGKNRYRDFYISHPQGAASHLGSAMELSQFSFGSLGLIYRFDMSPSLLSSRLLMSEMSWDGLPGGFSAPFGMNSLSQEDMRSISRLSGLYDRMGNYMITDKQSPASYHSSDHPSFELVANVRVIRK